MFYEAKKGKTVSVSKIVRECKQPRGGYVKPSEFEIIEFDDGKILNKDENVDCRIIGMVVDYLTRTTIGIEKEKAFRSSIYGAREADAMADAMVQLSKLLNKSSKSSVDCEGKALHEENALKLLNNINGVDVHSIVNACKLVKYDDFYRSVPLVSFDNYVSDIDENTNLPNDITIQNIQIMVQRGADFLMKYGPVLKEGFTFGKNGYSEKVKDGEGDFLTSDTIWDFKVSKNTLDNKTTLQLLMYWIMGQHSGKEEFKNITQIGAFNPRLNTAYVLPVSKLDIEIIRRVESEVICY